MRSSWGFHIFYSHGNISWGLIQFEPSLPQQLTLSTSVMAQWTPKIPSGCAGEHMPPPLGDSTCEYKQETPVDLSWGSGVWNGPGVISVSLFLSIGGPVSDLDPVQEGTCVAGGNLHTLFQVLPQLLSYSSLHSQLPMRKLQERKLPLENKAIARCLASMGGRKQTFLGCTSVNEDLEIKDVPYVQTVEQTCQWSPRLCGKIPEAAADTTAPGLHKWLEWSIPGRRWTLPQIKLIIANFLIIIGNASFIQCELYVR